MYTWSFQNITFRKIYLQEISVRISSLHILLIDRHPSNDFLECLLQVCRVLLFYEWKVKIKWSYLFAILGSLQLYYYGFDRYFPPSFPSLITRYEVNRSVAGEVFVHAFKSYFFFYFSLLWRHNLQGYISMYIISSTELR